MSEGRIAKYFGTPNDSSGNPLHWGDARFPFRGQPPVLKGDEIDEIPIIYDAKSEILQLPEQQKRYDEIIDHCANGWWQLRHERFIDNTNSPGTMTVFLAWLEIYGETPKNKSAWEPMKDVLQRSKSR